MSFHTGSLLSLLIFVCWSSNGHTQISHRMNGQETSKFSVGPPLEVICSIAVHVWSAWYKHCIASTKCNARLRAIQLPAINCAQTRVTGPRTFWPSASFYCVLRRLRSVRRPNNTGYIDVIRDAENTAVWQGRVFVVIRHMSCRVRLVTLLMSSVETKPFIHVSRVDSSSFIGCDDEASGCRHALGW